MAFTPIGGMPSLSVRTREAQRAYGFQFRAQRPEDVEVLLDGVLLDRRGISVVLNDTRTGGQVRFLSPRETTIPVVLADDQTLLIRRNSPARNPVDPPPDGYARNAIVAVLAEAHTLLIQEVVAVVGQAMGVDNAAIAAEVQRYLAANPPASGTDEAEVQRLIANALPVRPTNTQADDDDSTTIYGWAPADVHRLIEEDIHTHDVQAHVHRASLLTLNYPRVVGTGSTPDIAITEAQVDANGGFRFQDEFSGGQFHRPNAPASAPVFITWPDTRVLQLAYCQNRGTSYVRLATSRRNRSFVRDGTHTVLLPPQTDRLVLPASPGALVSYTADTA